MSNGDPEATTKDPDDVHDQRQATGRCCIAHYFLTKGPQRQYAQLKALQPKGNTDDGEAKHKATYKVAKGRKESAEDEPDEIAECVHDRGLRGLMGLTGFPFIRSSSHVYN